MIMIMIDLQIYTLTQLMYLLEPIKAIIQITQALNARFMERLFKQLKHHYFLKNDGQQTLT